MGDIGFGRGPNLAREAREVFVELAAVAVESRVEVAVWPTVMGERVGPAPRMATSMRSIALRRCSRR